MTETSEQPVRFAAVGLDHSHVFGQITGLLAQGCKLVGVIPKTRCGGGAGGSATLARRAVGRRPGDLLRDPTVDLIVTAAVPDRRAAIAIAALRNGKDVVADKPGCITLDELDEIEKTVAESGRFWSVTFSERFEVRCAVKAGELVRAGRIGRVVQTLGLGPHREGDRAHLAGGDGPARLVLRPQPVRRHPHRHRQPSDRPVPVVHRLRRPPRSCASRSPTTPIPTPR